MIDCRHSPCSSPSTEKLADGTLKAEPLSLVVSLFEEEQQDAKKPDHSRQYNIQLDSPLTITTKRRYQSTEPTDEKGLPLKYAILTNLWLLGQMRQPGRSIYEDFNRTTFVDFLDTLLDRDNFNFHKEVNGRTLISPCWSFCLSYEFELQKEAIRLCKGTSDGCTSCALDCTPQPRASYEHWLQLVAIPNAPSSSSGPEIQALNKRISDLEERRDPDRSAEKLTDAASDYWSSSTRSPRTFSSRSGTERRERRKGGNNQRKRSKGQGTVGSSTSSQQSGPKSFEYLMKLRVEFRENFHERFHKKEICFNFQKKSCSHQNCKWAHICVGCGGPKPYDDCQCLSGKVR